MEWRWPGKQEERILRRGGGSYVWQPDLRVPVWPGWGREEDDYEDHYSDESDSEAEEEICRKMIKEVAKDNVDDISLTYEESFTNVFDADSVVKMSKVIGSSLAEKPPICNSKENIPLPVNCAQLYLNKSLCLYTQELS